MQEDVSHSKGPTMRVSEIKPPQSILALANGVLCRAVVSLPSHMAAPDRLYEERYVFFEADDIERAGRYLETLLSNVWCIDTTGWSDKGYIYNIFSVQELKRNSLSIADNDLQLLETGSGKDAIGPDRIYYASADQVDLFVTPLVAKRLREALDAIELLHIEKAQRDKQTDDNESSLRYYAQLTEQVRHFGRYETEIRWVSFTTKKDWLRRLAKHTVEPQLLVSVVFHDKKPADIEPELMW